MKKTKEKLTCRTALDVRMETDLKRDFKRIADEMGMSDARLLRMIVKTYCDSTRRSGWHITLPLKWNPS
jgi:hypothetical protein